MDDLEAYGWSKERIDTSINSLIQEGIVWIDLHEGKRNIYFPSLMKI